MSMANLGDFRTGDGVELQEALPRALTRLQNGEEFDIGQLVAYDPEREMGLLSCGGGRTVLATRTALERARVGDGDEICFFKDGDLASLPFLRLAVWVRGGFALRGCFLRHLEDGAGEGLLGCGEAQDFFGPEVRVPAKMAAGMAPGQWIRFNARIAFDRAFTSMWLVVRDCEQCPLSWQPVPGVLSAA